MKIGYFAVIAIAVLVTGPEPKRSIQPIVLVDSLSLESQPIVSEENVTTATEQVKTVVISNVVEQPATVKVNPQPVDREKLSLDRFAAWQELGRKRFEPLAQRLWEDPDLQEAWKFVPTNLGATSGGFFMPRPGAKGFILGAMNTPGFSLKPEGIYLLELSWQQFRPLYAAFLVARADVEPGDYLGLIRMLDQQEGK